MKFEKSTVPLSRGEILHPSSPYRPNSPMIVTILLLRLHYGHGTSALFAHTFTTQIISEYLQVGTCLPTFKKNNLVRSSVRVHINWSR